MQSIKNLPPVSMDENTVLLADDGFSVGSLAIKDLFSKKQSEFPETVVTDIQKIILCGVPGLNVYQYNISNGMRSVKTIKLDALSMDDTVTTVILEPKSYD